MARYTIGCKDHALSDGRIIGSQPGVDPSAVWFESEADAQARADEQTDFSRQAGLDCIFEVRSDEVPLDLTFQDAILAVLEGVDIVALGQAGLVTLNGTSPPESLMGELDSPGYL